MTLDMGQILSIPFILIGLYFMFFFQRPKDQEISLTTQNPTFITMVKTQPIVRDIFTDITTDNKGGVVLHMFYPLIMKPFSRALRKRVTKQT